MDLLTKEEVLHVANLARIDITEDEIDVYRKDLKELINEIDKIKNVSLDEAVKASQKIKLHTVYFLKA